MYEPLLCVYKINHDLLETSYTADEKKWQHNKTWRIKTVRFYLVRTFDYEKIIEANSLKTIRTEKAKAETSRYANPGKNFTKIWLFHRPPRAIL